MKTAVEQLEDVLNKRLNHLLDNRVHIKEFVRTAKSSEIRKILETIHKFKEMEKENIIKAHTNGWNKGLQNNFIASQDYYNETFKSETIVNNLFPLISIDKVPIYLNDLFDYCRSKKIEIKDEQIIKKLMYEYTAEQYYNKTFKTE